MRRLMRRKASEPSRRIISPEIALIPGVQGVAHLEDNISEASDGEAVGEPGGMFDGGAAEGDDSITLGDPQAP